MKILKFGGTSLADPDRVRGATRLVRAAAGDSMTGIRAAMVVSAFGGVTNDLHTAAAAAARRDKAYKRILKQITTRHWEAARELVADSEQLLDAVGKKLTDLDNLLHGAFLLRECSPRTLDGILTYGERLSAMIVAAAMTGEGTPATFCDARELVVTDASFGRAQVDIETSSEKIRAYFGDLRAVPVITGFTGATPEGQTTTLGRGGSDYTAALFGAAIGAEAIEIWTDVDGVMSADPRLVEGAFPLPSLSYTELMEMSHFGAKVVYPPTIHPARSQGIPLVIKNTLNPEAPGTTVGPEAPDSEHAVRGISSIPEVALMRLEGDGMIGVPGIAMRLFGALARQGVSVILISQASSEHSICFAVAPEDAERARAAVDREFELEKKVGIIDELVVEDGYSVIAAVGEGMGRRSGIAGRLFSMLGDQAINVRAVAQGSSELNISLVVDRRDEAKALNAIHGAFFTPQRRRIALALLGPGRVGATFLEQLRDAAAGLAERERLEIVLVALASSRRMVLDAAGIDLGGWRSRLELKSEALDEERLLAFLEQSPAERRILVDCTASDRVAGAYVQLLSAGVAVVAANKKPFAGPAAVFASLKDAARRGGAPLFHEATVGAGLPVLSTLADLERTGDRVQRIDGVLSGTVNAVLDRLAGGQDFSRAVRSAHEEGLTEPHPFEDLSGGDVARKLCILGRLVGREIELEEIEVEPVIGGRDWSDMDLEAFWSHLDEVDDDFRRRRDEAAAAGARLRYVASLDENGARVALEAVAPGHPAHGLGGADNLVAFTTERYKVSPLVLHGPGAGPAVTAGGVFADVLRAIDRRSS